MPCITFHRIDLEKFFLHFVIFVYICTIFDFKKPYELPRFTAQLQGPD